MLRYWVQRGSRDCFANTLYYNEDDFGVFAVIEEESNKLLWFIHSKESIRIKNVNVFISIANYQRSKTYFKQNKMEKK